MLQPQPLILPATLARMKGGTFVILDGLQDPVHARDLSARWAKAGIDNELDVAGQCASLRVDGDMDESRIHQAAAVARAYGVELRDRVGETFRPDNDLALLHDQMRREYRARFAQSLVFGLPALVVHHLHPILATGGGQSASSLAFPWLLELVLVGWALWVAALPILWQGVWALVHLRATADLLTSFIIGAAFLPSAIGVISMLFTDQPWFGVAPGPAFHLAMMAVMLATCQRWRMYAHIASLAGRGDFMMRRSGPLMTLWIAAAVVLLFLQGWQPALCFAMLMPPLISSGAINRMTPGWSMVLPVFAFVPVFVMGAKVLPVAIHAESLRYEIAAGFGWMMIAVMEIGWRRMRTLK